MANKMHFTSALLVLALVRYADGANCVKNNACSCTYDDGSGTVDFQNLAGTSGPRLLDQYDKNRQYKYSYNPCNPFTEQTCNNVAVCESTVDASGSTSFTTPAGTQDSATFTTTGGQLKIVYKTRPTEFNYQTTVTLKCDASLTGSPKFDIAGAVTFNTVEMTMTHASLCAIVEGGGGGLSIGSILIIIFFVGIIVYVAAGIVFMVFVKKESGPKIVPNVNFWTALPGYVKDGVLFVYNSVRGNRGEYTQFGEK
ncbi:uncharacterized protein LOC135500491 [Lineus longissimus]|uniref:uncharacterized protein LOC135500491 n=1 Tax=Lineus longissimus TaxID=88925 RepID=UPI002B4DEBEC